MNRRSLLFGLGAVVAAPAIVPYYSLMKLPRVPFAQLPSGLWVKALNLITNEEEVFPAIATSDGRGVSIQFTPDKILALEHITVGRDGHDLFWGNIDDRMFGDGETVMSIDLRMDYA